MVPCAVGLEPDRLARLVTRLDREDTARNSVRVYRVKYGDARQIAKVLTEMFVGGSQSSLDGLDNQLAPGSGSTTASSAADRLSLNGNSSSSSSGQLNGFASRMSPGTGSGGAPTGSLSKSALTFAATKVSDAAATQTRERIVAAAKERGIYVSTTGGYVESTVELTWALILATARRTVDECLSVRDGGWQTSVGRQLGCRVNVAQLIETTSCTAFKYFHIS